VSVVATTRGSEKLKELQGLGALAESWSYGLPLPVEIAQMDVAFVLCPPGPEPPEHLATQLEGVGAVVYCSSTGVYGALPKGQITTENSPTGSDAPRIHARLAAEDAMRAIGARIVRAAGIYGPGRNMVERLKAGRVRVCGDLDRYVNMVHVEDLATILLAAALRGENGASYIAAGAEPVHWITMARRASMLAGIELPEPQPLPENPDIRAFYVSSRHINNSHTLESLGVQLAFPLALNALPQLAS
jgi:nucleoside-diphosphate-sugar epimerase